MDVNSVCEKCLGSLTDEPYVFLCAHDCVFCRKCGATLRGICPNCGANLARHEQTPEDQNF